ncbi:hypothetical protein ADL19_19750 [Streptomyces purpurogeneiscleroticus]|nr:hypothetical protein ADL19_19750 [Streptomyces purpurogeneiscleroticus]
MRRLSLILALCAALALPARAAFMPPPVPQGPFTAYTPSLSCVNGFLTSATATGGYQIVGKIVFWQATVTITTNGTCAQALSVGLPPGLTVSSARPYTAFGRENAKTGAALQAYTQAGAAFASVTAASNNAYAGQDGAVFYISGFYEAQ